MLIYPTAEKTRKLILPELISLKLETTSKVSACPDDHIQGSVTSLKATICHGENPSQRVGDIQVRYANTKVLSYLGFKPPELFSDEAEVNKILCNKKRFAKKFQKELDDVQTILYIDGLFLLKKFRGKNLGYAALHALLKYSPLTPDIVFLQAYPYANTLKKNSDIDEISAKLVSYYKKMGFKQLDKSNYLGINPSSLKDPLNLEKHHEFIANH